MSTGCTPAIDAAADRDATQESPTRRLRYTEYRGVGFADGSAVGLVPGEQGIGFGKATHIRDHSDPHGDDTPRRYVAGTWTSPVVRPGFAYTELVASWQADTPGASWLELAVQVSGDAGTGDPETDGDGDGTWYPLARWAEDDGALRPASVPFSDRTGRTSTDAFIARRTDLTGYRIRVTLLRPFGSTDVPVLTSVGVIASAGPASSGAQDGPGTVAAAGGRTLDVPVSSQRAHSGQYPHWDGGGDAWCSPTSTSMVLRFWETGPEPQDYAWVRADYADGFIHHAVRHCYDYSFTGTGNWAFNTAYAARYGLSAFVTRLRNLAEAELFVAAGIPLVASIRFAPGELTGADYPTNGHLLVVVGFTASGDVVVNDPAAPQRDTVRRTYDRHEFARAWLGGSGGAVYVIRPPHVALPTSPTEPNW